MRNVRSIVVLAAFAAAVSLFSCKGGRNAASDVDFSALDKAGDAAGRDDAFREVQGTLLTEGAASDAEILIKAAERRRTEQDGLIRESIDLSKGTLRYWSVNPSAVAGFAVSGDEAAPNLEIVDYGPEGELPAENKRPNIYVMFNQPMVPLAALGEPMRESPLLSLDPPVEGTYRWYGTKTLGFRPDEPLIDTPRYGIVVSRNAKALSGKKLGEDFSFDVFAERVKLVNLFPGNDADAAVDRYDVPTDVARYITLEFNQPVDPQVISKSVTVSAGNRAMPFSAGRPDYPERLASRTDRAVLITLDEEPPESERLTIALAEGAVPFEGYPPTRRETSQWIWTIRPFAADRLSAYAGRFPNDNRPFSFPVVLHFSHPLPEDAELPDFPVTVDGVAVEPEDVALSWSSISFFLPGVEPGQRVEIDVPPGVKDVFGREARRDHLEQTIPRPYPAVEFPGHYDGLRHLEAEFRPSLVWTSRNVVEGALGLLGADNFYDKPGRAIPMEEVDFGVARDDFTFFHEEDLSSYLSEDGYGTVFLNYEMQRDPTLVNAAHFWSRGSVAVQVTDLGLTVRVAYNRVLVWVNRLSDGTPVGGADVTVFNTSGKSFIGKTDASGLAVVPIPEGDFARRFSGGSAGREEFVHVRAESGGDLAEMRVRNTNHSYSFGVYNVLGPENAAEPVQRIHMFTDRGLYKPGEELALRGIHWTQTPDGFESRSAAYDISIVEAGSGVVVWSANGRTTDSGGFAHRLDLPDDLDPGQYEISYDGRGFHASEYFRIASFRRTAFQVRTAVDGPVLYHGDTIEAGVTASYLAGGAMPSASYHYYWTRKPVSFVPPGTEWKDWAFGTTDWAPEQTLSSGDGNLSGAGSARISEGTVDHEVTGKAYRYTLETTVEDVDRQVVSSVGSAIVHPAEYYVGARFGGGTAEGWWSRFVPVGDTVEVRAALADVDGSRPGIEAPLTVGLIKGEWKSVDQQGLYGRLNTRWEYVEEELWKEEKSLKDGAADFEMSVDEPGRYDLFFEYVDEAGRTARTEIDFYATGSGWVRRAGRTPSDINLTPDKELYSPGETARILVQSPIPSGRYLLTIEREGILDQKVISLDGSNEVIEVPIREEYLPVFYAALTSFTERTETEDDYFEPDLGKPRGLFGLTTIRVDTEPVELDVEVRATGGSYGPGDEAEVIVDVTRDGTPVAGAEVTLLAVDRGVLDLLDYHVPNPLEYFYSEAHFPHGVMGDDSRRLLLRPVTYEISNLQGGGSAKLEVRKDFNPLALFEPFAVTDANGRATVKVDLPDTLSTYRLTAVALEGVRLGYDEDEFQVRNPINVRTALPRRFRNRDTAAAGVVLTNTTAEDHEVTVSVESDILAIAGDSEKTVTLPANATMELPFVFEAVDEGEGVIRFTTRSDVLNEVLEDSVTVERPLVKEAFATIGAVLDDPDAGGEQSVGEVLVIPEHAAEGYGSLAIIADSSLMPHIDSALENLQDVIYPSLNDDLYALVADLAEKGRARGKDDVFDSLEALQFPDGGIGYRPPSVEFARPSWFLSALTAHVAREIARYEGPFDPVVDLEKLDDYLAGRLAKAEEDDAPSFLATWTAQLLAESGAAGPAELSWLMNAEDRLGIAGYNLLAQAYAAMDMSRESGSLYRRSRNFVDIGTRGLDIKETYEAKGYFSSMEAETALMLRTAVLLGEDDEFVLRLAGALNGERHSRRFHSRFDDFWIVSGFLPLLAEAPKRTAYRLTVDAGGNRLLEERIGALREDSVSAEFAFADPPLSSLEKGEPTELRITKDGRGNLYYATTLTYALPTETALPRDEGLEVITGIETLGGEPVDPSNLPLGETLRMRVSVSTLARRSFLKLVVPIPSGAEIVDPSLAITGNYADAGGTGGELAVRETVYGDEISIVADGYAMGGPMGWDFWFYRPIQKIYDNAVSYMWEDFYAGRREVTFLIRTTTPGVYPTPPATASLEFEPEVFGRGGGNLSIIRGE